MLVDGTYYTNQRSHVKLFILKVSISFDSSYPADVCSSVYFHGRFVLN